MQSMHLKKEQMKFTSITHAVLSGDAVKKIKIPKIKKLIITDTIENTKKLKIIIKLRCYQLPHLC